MQRYGESKRHFEQKEKIRTILEAHGWNAFTEYPFECITERGPITYWGDCYAENFSPYMVGITSGSDTTRIKLQSGMLRLVCEILGCKGRGNHSTKRHRYNDQIRRNAILGKEPDIKWCELWTWQIQGSTDSEIYKEILWQIEHDTQRERPIYST